MQHWLYWYGAVLCASASLSLLLITSSSAAEAEDFLFFPLPSQRIQSLGGIKLPNGDAAVVYYPELPSEHTFVDAFPIVAVLQGAQVDKSQYKQFGRGLARFGFVVVIPNHFRSPAPGAPPALFASRTVIPDVLAQMEAEDADPGSPLYQIVDTDTLALAGHSFGGVVGLFASAAVDVCAGPFIPPFLFVFCDGQYTRPAALRAAAFYGTSLVQGGVPVQDLNTTGVAIALVQGERDGLSPLQNAELTYPTLERPRALITIEGANHYGITNVNNPPGAIPDPNAPTLGQAEAVARVARWTGLWLRARLCRDPLARFFIYTLHGSLDGVVSVRTD